jgi:hypothetical protein
MKMESAIWFYSSIVISLGLVYLIFRKRKRVKRPIDPEEKFIGSTYIPDIEGKEK